MKEQKAIKAIMEMKLTYQDNPKEILDKLLEYHDIKILREILNSKARKKEPRGNHYFVISVQVYLMKKHNSSKLEWAINEIAEQNNISDKTVKNHIHKFRTEIKNLISDLNKDHAYSIKRDTSTTNFIELYIQHCANDIEFSYYQHMNDGTYSYFKSKLDDYRSTFFSAF